MNNEKKGINIELNDEIAQGTYANLAIIAHSSSEFVIDFARILPGIPKPSVKSRIIMSPEHAKRLLLALNENIQRFERQHGSINLNKENNDTIIPFGMSGDA